MGQACLLAMEQHCSFVHSLTVHCTLVHCTVYIVQLYISQDTTVYCTTAYWNAEHHTTVYYTDILCTTVDCTYLHCKTVHSTTVQRVQLFTVHLYCTSALYCIVLACNPGVMWGHGTMAPPSGLAGWATHRCDMHATRWMGLNRCVNILLIFQFLPLGCSSEKSMMSNAYGNDLYRGWNLSTIMDQNLCKSDLEQTFSKNPAYSRHWLSWRARIIALCQKLSKKCGSASEQVPVFKAL